MLMMLWHGDATLAWSWPSDLEWRHVRRANILGLEADGVAHAVPHTLTPLHCHSVGHRDGRDAAGLGAQHSAGLPLLPRCVQQVLRYLGGLPTPRLTPDQDDLVACNGVLYLLPAVSIDTVHWRCSDANVVTCGKIGVLHEQDGTQTLNTLPGSAVRCSYMLKADECCSAAYVFEFDRAQLYFLMTLPI